MSRYVTLSEFARRAGVARQSVYNAIRDGRLEKTTTGKIDLGQLDGFLGRVRPRAPAVTDAPGAVRRSVDYQEERAHVESLKRDKLELEVKRLRGELIAVEDARRAYAAVITSARVALEAVPARVAPQVLGLDGLVAVRRIVQAEIAAALRSLPEDAPDVG